MNIVSFNQIIELNQLLQEKNLLFKVHIRDACGTQSFYIEPLGECACEGKNEEMYDTIEQYFNNNKMHVVYASDKYNFTIQ